MEEMEGCYHSIWKGLLSAFQRSTILGGARFLMLAQIFELDFMGCVSYLDQEP